MRNSDLEHHYARHGQASYRRLVRAVENGIL